MPLPLSFTCTSTGAPSPSCAYFERTKWDNPYKCNRSKKSEVLKHGGMVIHTKFSNTHYLSHNLQRSFSSLLCINCELCGLSNSQPTALKAWTICLNLKLTHLFQIVCGICSCATWKSTGPWRCADLVRVKVFAWWSDNLSHKGGVLDIFIVAENMHRILPRLRGPVAHITWSITFVVTLNLGLRWTFHRKT